MVLFLTRCVTAWTLVLFFVMAIPPEKLTAQAAEAPHSRAAQVAADSSPKYVPVNPARLLDTRKTKQRLKKYTSISVKVAGVAGVPSSNVKAVSINLTAVDPGGKGYLAAYANGRSRPLVSSLNFRANENTANHVIVPVGKDGLIKVYSHADADVIVDITGYTPDGAGLQTVDAVRALDTRTAREPLAARGTRKVPMAGRYGVPATGVDAVVVNVTAVDPQGKGYFTAYPSGAQRAVTSTLNFKSGENTANNATVKLGADGAISVFSLVQAHMIVDVVGYVRKNGAFAAIPPARSVDTRKLTLGKMKAGETRTLRIAGKLGLPANGLTAVAVNAVAVDPAAKGYLALFPAGVKRPLISAVNFDAGDNTANNALVKLSDDGAISVYSFVDAHVVIDVVGYTTAALPYSGATTVNTRGRTTTIVRKADTPTVINTKPTIPAKAAAELDALASAGNIVGAPVDLSLKGTFPAEGVRLERTYPAPLPDDATVSFVYWNTTVNRWIPMPGVISADRRSAHAIVHHYSLWGDIVSSVSKSLEGFSKTAGDAMTAIGKSIEKTIVDVVDVLAYEVGSFFDSRTKPQSCDVPLPSWVSSASFIEQHFNNPVHWCVQGVAGDSDKVAISAKANRGHGFVLGEVPAGMTVTNDSFDADLHKTLANITTDRGQVIANTPLAMLYSANYIPPGATATVTLSQEAYYGVLNRKATVKAEIPHWLLAVSSIIINQIVGAGEGMLEGRAAAAILVSNCWVQSMGIEELQGNALGIYNCLSSADGLSAFDVPITKKARAIALRANLAMAIVGAVNNGMVFGLDSMVDGAAYRATVFGKVGPRTEVLKIAPFDRAGKLKAGWSIYDATGSAPLDGCYPGNTSFTFGILACGPTAAGCQEGFGLKSNMMQIYCYNTGSKTLTKIGIDQPSLDEHTGKVYPSEILTADGSLYYKRFGGSWGSYGKYYGTYGCQSGPCKNNSALQMVVVDSEKKDDTFDKSRNLWRVRVAGVDSRETVPPPPWVDVLKVWYLHNETFD